jgi:excisionase family DNA binding protein
MDISEAQIPNRLTLRPDEVAKIFGVCLTTVYKWKKDGVIPAIKNCKPLRFRTEDVVNFMKETE